MYTFTYIGPTKIEIHVKNEHRMLFWALDAICFIKGNGYWWFNRELMGVVENLCAAAGLRRESYEQKTSQEVEAG